METQKRIGRALERLASSMDGARSLVVSSREGVLISSTGKGVDEEELCALGAKLISTSKWVGKELKLKDFESTIVEFEDGTILAYGHGSVSIMAIIDKGSNVELMRLLLRSFAEETESMI